jgi:hypothetical protein
MVDETIGEVVVAALVSRESSGKPKPSRSPPPVAVDTMNWRRLGEKSEVRICDDMIYPLTAVGGAMDGSTNTLIGSAHADVIDRIVDIGIGGMRVLR